jgi:hypothetical protein
MLLIQPRVVLGLLLIPFSGCFNSGHQHLDVDTAEESDAVESPDPDVNEDAPDVMDTDIEDAPAPCEFGALMDPVQLTFHERYPYHAALPTMVFTGSEFAIVWLDNRNTLGEEDELFYTALTSSGEKVFEDLQLTQGADPGYVNFPDAAFTGSEIGVVFIKYAEGEEYRMDLFFMRLTLDGYLMGSETGLTMDDPAGLSDRPLIAFSGNGYGIAWTRVPSLMFMRLDLDGNTVGEDLVLDPDFQPGREFSLIHAESAFAMVWDRDGEKIAFARVSDEGAVVDGPRDLTSGSLDNCPSIAFNGAGYGIVYERPTLEPHDNNLYFFRLSSEGERLSPDDIRLTDDLEYPHYPKIIHNGSEYAVAWYNNNASGVFLDRLDEDGNLKGESFKITENLINSNRFQIVPAEDYYAAVWAYGENLMFGRFGCLDRADP